MKNIILLILSLMAGSEAPEEPQENTGDDPNTNEIPEPTDVIFPATFPEQNSKTEEWRKSDVFFLQRTIENAYFRLIVKDKRKDNRTYHCKSNQWKTSANENVNDKRGCKTTVNQTAYGTAETTISCSYLDHCQFKNSFTCKTITLNLNKISTNSSPKSNGKFTLIDTVCGFNLSISNVSSEDAGTYWCGLKKKAWKLPSWTHTNTTTCQKKNNKSKQNITITLKNVRTTDSGTYWCGAENNDKQHSKDFFHKLTLNVAPPAQFTPSLSSAQMTTVSAQNNDPAEDKQPVIVRGFLLMLLALVIMVIAIIAVYKRYSHSKNAGNRAVEQQPKDEYLYEEIPDVLPTSTTTAIYALADFPTNTPDSLHYSTINFQHSSADEPDGEGLVLRPSSASCQYSVIKGSPSSTSFTDPSSRSTDEPIYSTVSKP
ncbi:uncharacterized protein LOC112451114 [Kryptolebias marmoratus]|uniref:uncharacterized protein LOC112451114 n=1 Tax=Kryptolebias marmoratus TaxID=37003 RepID=UPI0018ACA1BB|nr:uncharacterized protein LOC112451114 [Kryptolebias marmoratus]